MRNAINPNMGSLKEFIAESVEELGGWRPAGRELGVDFQYLQYWYKSGKKIQDFLDSLEKIRVKRGLKKSTMWDRLISGKLKKG